MNELIFSNFIIKTTINPYETVVLCTSKTVKKYFYLFFHIQITLFNLIIPTY